MTETRTGQARDSGMTLIELLIAMSLVGVIAAVLSTAIIVTLNQQDNTEGRLNVARAEQNISMWIPADLASADDVIKDPEASPCGAPVCDGIDLSNGSNVLMLSWQEVVYVDPVTQAETVHRTNVSYNFYPDSTGLYLLRRVECTDTGSGWSCQSNVVLRDLPGPPAGQSFVAGVGVGSACADPDNHHPDYENDTPLDPADDQFCTVPDWVVVVSFPLIPEATTDSSANLDQSEAAKNANRVIVTVTGGGDSAGAGGGVNHISITAGGTVRRLLPADSAGVPEFVEARSRCGGPLTLILDRSGSIANANATSYVQTGAVEFVKALIGTPVQLQVLLFSATTEILGLGQTTSPQGYYDMSDVEPGGDVDELLAQLDDQDLDNNDTDGNNTWAFGGNTNWEDALFHTFFTPGGLTPLVRPETVVLFTDGAPTTDRTINRTDSADLEPPELYDPVIWQQSGYRQASYNRAEYIAKSFRVESGGSIRLIGVGVGGIDDNVTWITDPGNPYQSRVDFERRPETSTSESAWTDITPTTYYQRQAGDGYSYQIRSGAYRSWYPVTKAEYDGRSVLPSTYRDTTGNDRYWQISTNNAIGRSTSTVQGKTVLSRLIAGSDNGTVYNGTNAELADMFLLSSSQWDQLPDVLRTVALGECGGTLTLSTRNASGSPVADPFTYQKNKVYGPAGGSPATVGTDVQAAPSQTTTNLQFTTRTFDFTIDGASYITVEIVPQIDAGATTYQYGAWSCRAGLNSKTVHTFPTVDGWYGMRVDVRPNEAVSCTMTVT